MRIDPGSNRRPGPGDESNSLPLDWLISPGRVFSHPRDLLENQTLGASEKRAILASWASDLRAVESEPLLRQVETGAVVPLSDILDALRLLDAGVGPSPGEA